MGAAREALSRPARGEATQVDAAGAALGAPPGRLNAALFWPFWWAVRLLLRLCFGFRVEGSLPRAGALVLAANHCSFVDPVLLGAAVRRRVVFLMTETVWRSPRARWFYRWNHALPLNARTANRETLRAARRVLQQGRVVGIFPEGGLSRDGGPLLGSPGAVSLVLSEGAPIVPIGIVGSARVLPFGARLPRFARVTIRIGAPILPAEIDALAPDRRARLAAATELIMARIAALTGDEPRAAAMRRLGAGD